MKKKKPIIFFIILSATITLFTIMMFARTTDVTVYLAPGYSFGDKEVQLNLENLTNPNFPKPRHDLPVLFVHGQHSGTIKNFRREWQQSYNDLPCFQETLELAENSWLGIEPYYIDLEGNKDDDENDKKNRSIEKDASKIKEAIKLILLHQGDPGATGKKVAIIAYGAGAISARYYLKKLWEEQNRRLSFHPVSELIAIAPPNHGLSASAGFIENINRDSLLMQQLCNGFDENCNRFPDPGSHNFIERLNDHSIHDTLNANYCASIFDSEAPGSRRNNEPLENGILYVTLYARGNRDIVGGGEPSGDCQGRVLAKNLAPNAENREIPGIPDHTDYPAIPGGDDKLAVHRNTVHMPEVICKALYTVVHHQAPPDELRFDLSEKNNWKRPPLVPRRQPPQQEEGIVLLFDISHSMSWQYDRYDERRGVEGARQRLSMVKGAAEYFLKLLADYGDHKKNVGIAVFPALPWSCELQKDGCAQAINPMMVITKTNIDDTIKTINCLTAQGNTPLLKGLDTALQIFGEEKRKAIILISDGHHNYPTGIKTDDIAVEAYISRLDEKQVTVHTIGLGGYGHMDVNHKLLRKFALSRKKHLQGKFFDVVDPGFTPGDSRSWNPGLALTEAYKSIFTTLLNLAEVRDSQGIIEAGETVNFPVKVNKYDRKISFLLSRDLNLHRATPGLGKLGITINSSDGKPVSMAGQGVYIHEGGTGKIITVDKQLLMQPGKVGTTPWKVNIDAHGLENGRQAHYFYCVIMDSALKMKTGFDKTGYKTGDTITITAAIVEGEKGFPVTGLTDVTALVTRPVEGPGNWFALNKISPRELENIPEAIEEEDLSRLQRKAIFLAKKRSTLLPGLPQRISPVLLRLYDDGTHGDKKEGDGIYTTQYTDTAKEGTYCFRFRAAGDTFEREKKEQVVVTARPHPGSSTLEIRWHDTSSDDPAQDIYYIKLVPRDFLGNFLGPGHTVEVNVVYNKEKSSQLFKLDDYLDGTYKGEPGISRSGHKTGVHLEFSIDGQPFTIVEKIPRFRKKSLGIYTGIGVPVYSLDRSHKNNINFGCHSGYQLSSQFSLVGIVGFNRFKSRSSSNEHEGEQWWNMSVNLKSGVVKVPFQVYVDVGPGIYLPKNGALRPGFNVGVGATYRLKVDWGIEVGINFHHLFTRGAPDPNFFVTYNRLVYYF